MSSYPRIIKLDKNTEERLANYIESELILHDAERGDYIRNLQSWQIDYWAEPSTAVATFPFQNAATLIIPLAAISVEAIHSRVMTTMTALSQFVSAKPMHPDWQNHARPVEKFIDSELLQRAKIIRPLNSSILEIIKFGTGVAKVGYEKITKRAVREIGDEEEEIEVTIKQGVTIDSIPVSRFLMPYIYNDPQTAAWCGEEHEFTPYEIRTMELNGLYDEGTMEKLKSHFTTVVTLDESQETQEKLESREPSWPQRVQIHEIWLSFDVEGVEDSVSEGLLPPEVMENAFDKEIVVHYHRHSRTFCAIRYNWHEDLHRPYYYGVYFPVEHRWAGIGVCKQTDQFQQEITTQHRQRIDNATLANCRMIKISNLSKYGPDEPIFPGKMWFVDSKDDIETFQLGEIYSSSYSNENQSLLYAQQRTGVNEVNLGMPQQGTPGTATSDLARIQEGNKKFDYTYRNIKSFTTEVVKGAVLNIKQFGPRASVYYEVVENGNLVRDFFSQDYTKIKEGLLLEIEVAGQQDNKLLDRNNWQQVAQLLTGYYDSMIGLAQAKGDTALLATIVDHGMRAATETMKQILESFDLKNVDRIIVQEALQNGKLGAVAGAGTNSGPQNALPSAGMGINGNAAPQLAGSGNAAANGIQGR